MFAIFDYIGPLFGLFDNSIFLLLTDVLVCVVVFIVHATLFPKFQQFKCKRDLKLKFTRDMILILQLALIYYMYHSSIYQVAILLLLLVQIAPNLLMMLWCTKETPEFLLISNTIATEDISNDLGKIKYTISPDHIMSNIEMGRELIKRENLDGIILHDINPQQMREICAHFIDIVSFAMLSGTKLGPLTADELITRARFDHTYPKFKKPFVLVSDTDFGRYLMTCLDWKCSSKLDLLFDERNDVLLDLTCLDTINTPKILSRSGQLLEHLQKHDIPALVCIPYVSLDPRNEKILEIYKLILSKYSKTYIVQTANFLHPKHTKIERRYESSLWCNMRDLNEYIKFILSLELKYDRLIKVRYGEVVYHEELKYLLDHIAHI